MPASPAPRTLLDRIFDPAYRENLNPATRVVPLLHGLYLLCIPLAKLFVTLKVAPNTITHLSNATAAAAVAALIWAANPWLFPALWFAALMLDVADGIVARTTRTASARGSFFDHMSDQVKVVAVFLGTGLRYDATEAWVLAYAACTAYLFLGVMNQNGVARALRLAAGMKSAGAEMPSAAAPAAEVGALRAFVRRHPRLRAAAVGLYSSVVLMYGNSMLWILPLSFGREAALAASAFFLALTLYNMAGSIRTVGRVNDQLTAARIPWR
jgi:phosphatidylglycerophosphate synthase